MNKSDILSLFEEWNAALQTGEPEKVASLYDSDAILLPTVSNKIRHSPAEIADYFAHFLSNSPQGTTDEAIVRIFGKIAINSGIYTFAFADGSAMKARFTFVYRWNGTRWMIVEHHSSQISEQLR